MNANLQTVEVVIPVYDEERALGPNIELLLGYLRSEFPFPFRVVVADNASRDATPLVAAELARRHEEVSVLRLEEKGRGRALRTAWSASRGARRLVHGRRPVDEPRELPAARRADHVGAQRARDRHPPRPTRRTSAGS